MDSNLLQKPKFKRNLICDRSHYEVYTVILGGVLKMITDKYRVEHNYFRHEWMLIGTFISKTNINKLDKQLNYECP